MVGDLREALDHCQRSIKVRFFLYLNASSSVYILEMYSLPYKLTVVIKVIYEVI